MRKFSAIIFLLCTFALTMSAQHIQRNYHDRSMSDVLIDLDKASKRYKISFIYNELEDFTVTQNVKTATCCGRDSCAGCAVRSSPWRTCTAGI